MKLPRTVLANYQRPGNCHKSDLIKTLLARFTPRHVSHGVAGAAGQRRIGERNRRSGRVRFHAWRRFTIEGTGVADQLVPKSSLALFSHGQVVPFILGDHGFVWVFIVGQGPSWQTMGAAGAPGQVLACVGLTWDEPAQVTWKRDRRCWSRDGHRPFQPAALTNR